MCTGEAHGLRSEDNSWESVFSFQHMFLRTLLRSLGLAARHVSH